MLFLLWENDLQVYDNIKKRHRLLTVSFKYGADDEARTRYLHLGKVALYQMSYSRILWCLRAESLFCGKATAVETIHRIVSKCRLSIPSQAVILISAIRRLSKSGASGRNRTTDTGIFSPLLYRLSYRGKLKWRPRWGSNPRPLA